MAHRQRKNGARRRGLVRLVQGDARPWLADLPDQSVDLIITDPPYRFGRGGKYFRDWFAELGDDEWPAIFEQLYRVLVPNAHAYVFADRRVQPIFEGAATSAGFRVHYPLVWDKVSIGLGGGCWRPRHELIGFYEKGYRPGNRRDLPDLLPHRRVTRRYPTQKPIALLGTLIIQASQPGELVLDPFCGSGSTGKAAHQLNRRALLCDVDAQAAARALRLAIGAPDPTLA